MELYPIVLKLEGIPCLIIGGGAVAARKARQLLAAGAAVTVLAPRLGGDLASLARAGAVRHLARRWREGDLRPFRLVFAATDSRAVNRRVFQEASAGGLLVNCADDPGNCNFFVPSILRRGDLLIAVSTSGKAPGLARRLREYLERKLGPGLGPELDRLQALRRQALQAAGEDAGERRRRVSRALEPEIGRLMGELERS